MQLLGYMSIAVAVSGIAVTLLSVGQTVHSGFRIPINRTENTTSGMALRSPEASWIRECAIILWGEASMISCNMLHVVNAMFQDVMETNIPFGGKVVIFEGDFRQILPIVKNGSRMQQIEICIRSRPLWKLFKIFKLDLNVRTRDSGGQFSQWTRKIREGTTSRIEHVNNLNQTVRYPSNIIEIPPQCIDDNNIEDRLLGNIQHEDISRRAVLCPTNADVKAKNDRVLKNFHEKLMHFIVRIDRRTIATPMYCFP